MTETPGRYNLPTRAMPESKKDTVMLRVEISEELRTRLKSQAVRVNKTMGELLEQLIEQPLRELEIENLGASDNKAPTNSGEGKSKSN